MGTRNLTMVIDKEGETKVAQYGQWDGYPDGQGATALDFLHNCDLEKLNEKLNELKWFTQDELKQLYSDENWRSKFPWLSRDLGADILNAIYFGKYEEGSSFSGKRIIECNVDKVINSEKFAGDSLFCEWAYVIDLQKGTFEVYEGFQKEPISEDERFYSFFEQPEHGTDAYYPVKKVKEWKLSELPTKEEFIAEFVTEDED